jgi:hypothetical protein
LELRDFGGYDIHVALDRDLRLAFVNAVMNPLAPKEEVNHLTS